MLTCDAEVIVNDFDLSKHERYGDDMTRGYFPLVMRRQCIQRLTHMKNIVGSLIMANKKTHVGTITRDSISSGMTRTRSSTSSISWEAQRDIAPS